jgi:Tol biopolymer transport system component
VNSTFTEDAAQVSPDGRWMAYTSNESGTAEVYVTAFPVPDQRWRVSQGGGAFPIWRRDGRELYFRKRAQVFSVPITPGESFRQGTATVLFEDRALLENFVVFDVGPDGRFLVNRVVELISPPLTVVSDWRRGIVQ